ncbi:MAG TPA: PrsW family intramembrane metalloprotease [Longimicrobiaceae bacterium]|nr:PrsW family intramembrane metalloprotease [Longimicrobiaceae bacterium]
MDSGDVKGTEDGMQAIASVDAADPVALVDSRDARDGSEGEVEAGPARRSASVDASDAAPTAPPKARGGARWVLLGPALLCGSLSLLMIGSEVGARSFVLGTVLAVLPVPFYVMLALWLDRFEAEPPGVLAQTFLWGAAVAVFIAMMINGYAESTLEAIAGTRASEVLGAVVSAPVVEEVAKGIALLFLYFEFDDEFDGVIDGVVYAAMVGLGFAMVENIQYYGEALNEGTQSSLVTFMIRGMMGPFAHPFFTSMIGIGLGVAREGPPGGRRYLPPLLGLVAAISLHALWNLAASFDQYFVPAYLLVMVPAFFGVLALIYVSLRRESGVIRDHLAPLVDDGLLDPAELECLCRVRSRLRATTDAWRAGGAEGWRLRRELHQTASELAFHRWRVRRGITRGPHADAAREAAYRRRLAELCAHPWRVPARVDRGYADATDLAQGDSDASASTPGG